jgi:hypothetical protein
MMSLKAPINFIAVTVSALLLGVSASHGQSWLFDFGGAATQTNQSALAGDDPLNFWNNITESIAQSSTASLLNVLTREGVVTDMDFLMVSRFNGVNSNGTRVSSLYAPDATGDSLYGNTGVFGGLSNVTPIFKLGALDPALTYNFKFFASRMTAGGDNREAIYNVVGGNSGSAALNASENIGNLVSVNAIAPDANGEITISLTPGPNNNNGGTGSTATRFIYIGVMEVQAVPEPGVIGMTTIAALAFLAQRRRARVLR